MIAQLRIFWNSLSITAKAVVVVVVLVALGIVATNLSGAISQYRSKRADAKVAEKQKEIDALQKERDAWTIERTRLLANADRDHAEGELNDAKAEATKALVAQQGTAVRDAELKKIEAIDAELKRDQAITSADISDSERCERVRTKYAAAGIKFECRP